MSKMNPEVKARWVAALRSGEYQQTKGCLKDSHGYCCLGVLCDLYDKDGWGKTFHHVQGVPPAEVRIWAGFPENGTYSQSLPVPGVAIDGIGRTLYMHNDEGRTFAEIADAIESQL